MGVLPNAVNLIQPVKSNKTQILAEVENVFNLRNLRSQNLDPRQFKHSCEAEVCVPEAIVNARFK